MNDGIVGNLEPRAELIAREEIALPETRLLRCCGTVDDAREPVPCRCARCVGRTVPGGLSTQESSTSREAARSGLKRTLLFAFEGPGVALADDGVNLSSLLGSSGPETDEWDRTRPGIAVKRLARHVNVVK